MSALRERVRKTSWNLNFKNKNFYDSKSDLRRNVSVMSQIKTHVSNRTPCFCDRPTTCFCVCIIL